MNIKKVVMLHFKTIPNLCRGEAPVIEKQNSIFLRERKCTSLRKHTNKNTFRCLIAMWIIGIARRGLNELIFVKTSNSTKIYFFHLFCL